MVRVLKLMRASRVLINNSFLDRRMKYKIDHSHEGMIDLDLDTSQAEMAASDVSSEKDQLEFLMDDPQANWKEA